MSLMFVVYLSKNWVNIELIDHSHSFNFRNDNNTPWYSLQVQPNTTKCDHCSNICSSKTLSSIMPVTWCHLTVSVFYLIFLLSRCGLHYLKFLGAIKMCQKNLLVQSGLPEKQTKSITAVSFSCLRLLLAFVWS